MMHKIGERISSLRKENHMSQEELATVLNVSRQTISKWETGDTLPDVYNAVALVKIFHVTLDELIFGVSKHSGQSSYMIELKEKRRSINVKSIIIGSIGSVLFATSIILLKALGADARLSGIIMACVMPVLMLSWGIAIWGFIKIARIQDEIKYLQKIELTSMLHNQKTNNEKDL